MSLFHWWSRILLPSLHTETVMSEPVGDDARGAPQPAAPPSWINALLYHLDRVVPDTLVSRHAWRDVEVSLRAWLGDHPYPIMAMSLTIETPFTIALLRTDGTVYDRRPVGSLMAVLDDDADMRIENVTDVTFRPNDTDEPIYVNGFAMLRTPDAPVLPSRTGDLYAGTIAIPPGMAPSFAARTLDIR